jgi:cytosine permease
MIDEHAREPVPESSTVSGFQVGLVCVGIAVTLPGLYTGGELAQGLGLERGILAVLIGAALLSVMSVPAAIVGARTRLSSYMIIEHVFGSVSAKFINFAFGIVLLGWYAVTAELFGRTLHIAMADFGFTRFPEWLWIVLTSSAVIATTLFGFKTIDRLALIAVPFLLLFLIWIVNASLGVKALTELLAMEPTGMTMVEGISVVIGAMIVNVVLMPDLTRYARTQRDCVTAAWLGNGGGVTVSTALAMVPALALGTLDAMDYMIALGATGIALIVLVFATWTTNGVNLYSTGLVTGSALPHAGYAGLVIGCGAVGTVMAVTGVADQLINFLILLGLIVPPVAGVYLSRFFLLGDQDFSQQHFDKRGACNWPETLACLLGGSLATWSWVTDFSPTGIVPVESLLLTGTLYLLIRKVFR